MNPTKHLAIALATALLVAGHPAPSHADDVATLSKYAPTLGADIEESCRRLQAESDPHKALEAFFYKRMCMMPTSALRSLDDAVKKGKPIKERTAEHVLEWGILDRNRSEQHTRMLIREAALASTHLSNFLLAETFTPAADVDAFSRDFSSTLLFYLSHKSIDASKLEEELASSSTIVGSARDFLFHQYERQHARFVKVDAMRKNLEPKWLRVFEVGEKATLAFDSQVNERRAFVPKLRKLGMDLVAGYAPSASQCEKEIFAFQKTLAPEEWNSPVAQMAAGIAMGCASARGEEEMVGAAGLHMSDRNSGFGRYSYAITQVNEYLFAEAAKAGEEPWITPQQPVLGGGALVGGRAKWGYERARWHPVAGPMKVASIEKVTYKGVPFLLVQGKGQKVKVPVMSCTSVRAGWRFDMAGRLTENNANSCRSTGTKMERIDTEPLLVPEADAPYIKKGQWMRFKGQGQVRARDVSGGAFGKSQWAFFAAPALSAKKEKEFAGDETWTALSAHGDSLRAPLPAPPPAAPSRSAATSSGSGSGTSNTSGRRPAPRRRR